MRRDEWYVGERGAEDDLARTLQKNKEEEFTHAVRSLWERLSSRGEPAAK